MEASISSGLCVDCILTRPWERSTSEQAEARPQICAVHCSGAAEMSRRIEVREKSRKWNSSVKVIKAQVQLNLIPVPSSLCTECNPIVCLVGDRQSKQILFNSHSVYKIADKARG